MEDKCKSLRGSYKPTAEQLYCSYIDERKSISQIAKEIGVSNGTVTSWLKTYNIPIRTISGSILPKEFVRPNREQLERMYVEERKSAKQIADELGVSSNSVMKYLRRYDISIRKVS